MIVFPAIDLIDGKVVRLAQGRRDQMTLYSHDPASFAQQFAAAGARWVHVVDLSAAFEEDEQARAANKAAIKAICACSELSVDVGGGVRSLERIEELLELGCKRVALGTVLVQDPDFAQEAVARFGEALVADVAAKAGVVRVNGWRDSAELALGELLRRLGAMGYEHLVYTDVSRDGMQTGIDVDTYTHVAHTAGFPVVASGGVSTLADIEALARLDATVIEGVIVGRALYEKTLTLTDALEVAHAH